MSGIKLTVLIISIMLNLKDIMNQAVITATDTANSIIEENRVTVDAALEYLNRQIPEIAAFADYIEKESNGTAHLTIRLPDDPSPVYNPGNEGTLRGYYYCFYVGESHEDHTVNWAWFYVKDDLTEILWEDMIDAEKKSIREWRCSEQYFIKMGELETSLKTEQGFTLTDAEEFEKCQEAFDMIKQGDWSMVTPHRSINSKWEQYKLGGIAENPAASADQNAYESHWLQADVNNDGMPELIRQDGNGDRTAHKKPIDLIFSWNGDHVDLVFIDFIDAMEFCFVSDNGKLIYESTIMEQFSEFTSCHFDEKWNRVFEESLQLIYYPENTFGKYGCGLYYQYVAADGTVEDLTQKEFTEAYHNMTGQEFLEDNADYWEDKFKEAVPEEK